MNNKIRDEFLNKQDEYIAKYPYGWQESVRWSAVHYAGDYVKKKYNLNNEELNKILGGM